MSPQQSTSARVPSRSTEAGTLRRERLLARLAAVADARLRVLLGPAGSGKSVLLRQLAATVPEPLPVRAGAGDADLLAGLGSVLDCAPEVDAVLTAFDRLGHEVTLLVDDAHPRTGSAALTRLVREAPAGVRFVVATRDERAGWATDVPGAVHWFGYADLRLRTWDVEELFSSVYGVALGPEEAAALCARIEGLPVAARLLHVDTVLLGARERAAAFAEPLAGSRQLTGWLSREVLGPLPPEVHEFMVGVSPLGVLDGPLCDALLDRRDSGAVLADLAAGQALTLPVPGGVRAYRFHTLLQQHLEGELVERRGRHLARQDHHSAAGHLATAGHWAEAYRGYARAEDWVAAAEVRHRARARVGGLRAAASVPHTLLDDDPWVALAEARRLRGEGRLAESYDRYLHAEDRLSNPGLRWQCSLERSGVARWIPGGEGERDGDPLVDDMSAHVAAAVRGRPVKLLARTVPATSPEWDLSRAVAAMLDGRPRLAAELAEPLGTGRGFVALAARLLVAVLAASTAGRVTTEEFAALSANAQDAGWLWLARVARAGAALLDPDACADAAAVLDECREVGDEWGALLTGYVLAVGLVRAGHDEAVDVLTATAARAARLGARVPETWLRVLLADELGRRGDPAAAAERERTDALVASTAVERAGRQGAAAVYALRTPAVPAGPALAVVPEPVEPVPPVVVRCLGSYALVVAGTPVDLDVLRAQARRVLRVLSMHYGQPLHEERLVAALWPDAPLKQAKHRLQVAISSLRALLRQHAVDGFGILRHGSTYLLALPQGSSVDVVDFAEAVRDWRESRRTRDLPAMVERGHRVLDLYRGELLSEEGATEWVLAKRESLRGEAAGVAVALAGWEMQRGDLTAAIEVCERALRIDELDHRLWSLLAEARSRAGNVAAARRGQQAYRTLLAEG
ncbi:BTAD domain-containing putative transcriptional regulator [Actinokineospora pegani]|uniref:BTAD domain-containing putative transcriptional regulator n=1 Tax=Actinokineospora pegani TaxID=2654637 RepID=UPI0012EA6AC3|nr:BTAD domain-containing putative transcriptional regulator [Actinokineospora pegani]